MMNVNCPNCGSENPAQAKFCIKCGKELRVKIDLFQSPVYCPYCGAANPESALYCQNCSKSLIVASKASLQPAKRDEPGTGSRCGWCGRPVDYLAISCPHCGRDPSGQVDQIVDSHVSQKSNKPAIAGVLILGGGLLDIVSGIRVLTADVSSLDLAIDVSGFLAFCGTVALILGFIAVIGGILSIKGTSFTFVLVASALGIIGVGPFYLGALLCFVGLILAVLGKDEYTESMGF